MIRLGLTPAGWAGLAVLALIITAALMSPLLAEWRQVSIIEVDLLTLPGLPPSARHWLGTDALGRDVFVRTLYAGRTSLVVAFTGALGSAALGLVIGAFSATAGGRVDDALMRLTDAVIALPLLPILIVASSVDVTGGSVALGPELSMILIITLFGWTTTARLVRAACLETLARDHVRAARALGVAPVPLMIRHVLPQVWGPLGVSFTLSAAALLLLESALSYLGVGLTSPAVSWGLMLTQAQELIWSVPEQALAPGTAIVVVVLALHLLADGVAGRRRSPRNAW